MATDKPISITDFEPGGRVTNFFVIRKNELHSYDGKPYLVLELGDRSGRIKGSYWGNTAQEFHDNIDIGKVVKVKASVIERNEANHLKIEKMRLAKEKEIDFASLIPTGQHSPDELMNRWIRRAKMVKSRHLSALLEHFISDDELMEKLKITPAGKLWHHAYLGGLMEHILSVEKVCRLMSRIYPLVDRDLLITGALLHDIGKVEELSAEHLFIDYTTKGRLLGHITLGYEMVTKKINLVNDFPSDLSEHLGHLILSHHGDLGLGSPVKPLSLEASILHHADKMDSEAAAFERIINREKSDGGNFSRWVNLAERYLYLKPYHKD